MPVATVPASRQTDGSNACMGCARGHNNLSRGRDRAHSTLHTRLTVDAESSLSTRGRGAAVVADRVLFLGPGCRGAETGEVRVDTSRGHVPQASAGLLDPSDPRHGLPRRFVLFGSPVPSQVRQGARPSDAVMRPLQTSATRHDRAARRVVRWTARRRPTCGTGRRRSGCRRQTSRPRRVR